MAIELDERDYNIYDIVTNLEGVSSVALFKTTHKLESSLKPLFQTFYFLRTEEIEPNKYDVIISYKIATRTKFKILEDFLNKTKRYLVVSLFGYPFDYDIMITELMKKYEFWLTNRRVKDNTIFSFEKVTFI